MRSQLARFEKLDMGRVRRRPTVPVLAYTHGVDRSRKSYIPGVLSVAVFGLAVLLLVVLQRSPNEAHWTTAQGAIQDTRIVPDHALQTQWGSQLAWRADYRVVYLVGGHEYAVWVDSGIRSESKLLVQLRLPQSHNTCSVRYDPERPEISVARCP
jgi:uncharacterized protein DUF3592